MFLCVLWELCRVFGKIVGYVAGTIAIVAGFLIGMAWADYTWPFSVMLDIVGSLVVLTVALFIIYVVIYIAVTETFNLIQEVTDYCRRGECA